MANSRSGRNVKMRATFGETKVDRFSGGWTSSGDRAEFAFGDNFLLNHLEA